MEPTYNHLQAYQHFCYQCGYKENFFIEKTFKINEKIESCDIKDYWQKFYSINNYLTYPCRIDLDNKITVIHKPTDASLCFEHHKFDTCNQKEKSATIKRLFKEKIQQGKLDGKSSLCRSILIEFGNHERYLILILSHYLADGYAMTIIERDFIKFNKSGNIRLKDKGCSKAFDEYQRSVDNYIKNQLPTEIPYWKSLILETNQFEIKKEINANENVYIKDKIDSDLEVIFSKNQQEISSNEYYLSLKNLAFSIKNINQSIVEKVKLIDHTEGLSAESLFMLCIYKCLEPWLPKNKLWIDSIISTRTLFTNNMALMWSPFCCIELASYFLSLDFTKEENLQNILFDIEKQRASHPSLGIGLRYMKYRPDLNNMDNIIPHDINTPLIELNYAAPLREAAREKSAAELHDIYPGLSYDPTVTPHYFFFYIDIADDNSWELTLRYNKRFYTHETAEGIAMNFVNNLNSITAEIIQEQLPCTL